MFVLFNKNKEFIGYSPDIPPQADILKKEILEFQSDLRIWKWDGNFDSGKMVNIFEEGYSNEDLALEQNLFKNINLKYPLGIQLANIMRQMKKIIEHLDSTGNLTDEQFADMADEILMAIDLQNKRIKYSQIRQKLFQSHD